MNVLNLDHVVIAVRDVDNAVRFFKKLGMDFVKIEQLLPDNTPVETLGGSCYASKDGSLELFVPIHPIRGSFLPEVKRIAKLLEEKESVLLRVGFRVKGADDAFFEQNGIGIERKYELDELKPLPHRNIKEFISREQDTLGIQMAFMEYD